MKSYDYLIYVEHQSEDNYNYPGGSELIEICTTLEKAINVISTLSGIRYNAARVVRDIKLYGTACGAYLRIWEPQDYREDGFFYSTRRYIIEKVERH